MSDLVMWYVNAENFAWCYYNDTCIQLMHNNKTMNYVPSLEKKLIIVSRSQLRYRSAICVHVLSERLMMRRRLCPPHDVYSKATWIYTPSSSVSLSSCLISMARACNIFVFFYNLREIIHPDAQREYYVQCDDLCGVFFQYLSDGGFKSI